MSNTSATGGYLAPFLTPTPLEDDELADFFQALIVGITGIEGDLVRPRWQPEAPNIPQVGVSWVALGITLADADVFAYVGHNPAGNGFDTLIRHEVLDIATSFYGVNAPSNCKLLRDGLQVAQNREVLTLNNMGLVSSGNIVTLPALMKEKWLYRVDMTFRVKRKIVREYAVESLLSANIILNVDEPNYVTTETYVAGQTSYATSDLAQAQIATDLAADLVANPGSVVFGDTIVFPNYAGMKVYAVRSTAATDLNFTNDDNQQLIFTNEDGQDIQFQVNQAGSYFVDYTLYTRTLASEIVIDIPVA